MKIVKKILGHFKNDEEVKAYKIKITVHNKDNSGSRIYSPSFQRLIRPFEYEAYKKLWIWFYLRESSQYTIVAENSNRISHKTFLREEISEIRCDCYEDTSEWIK